MNEPELEPARQRFTGPAQMLFQKALAGLLLIDPLTERILDANPVAQRLSEFSHAELLEMALRSLVRHEQPWHDWTLPLLAGVGDGADGFLLRTRQPDRWVPVRLGMTPVPLGEDESVMLVRLHDRRESLELLRRADKAESDLRHLLESVPQCLWSSRVGSDGRWTYRYLSPAVERLTGRRAGDFLAIPDLWQEVVDPDDRAAWREFRGRLLVGQPGALEYRLRRADGGSARVRELVQIAPHEGGLLLHGVLDELPHSVRADAPTDASESQQRIDGFARVLGTLSHDFNNLITGILGHVSLSRIGLPADGSYSQGMDQVEGVALRAAELCRRLSICAGQLSSRGGVLDHAAEIRRVVDSSTPTQPVQVVVEPDLPGTAADAPQFRAAAKMLLSNALEAGAGRILIRVRSIREAAGAAAAPLPLVFSYPADPAPRPEGWVCLQVQDEGPGLPDEVRQRLGEPFVTTRAGHSGLGLATILGIARAHGGMVQIHSRVGAGTCVSLAFPAAQDALAPAIPVPAQAAPSAGPSRGAVLLAEDEPAVMEVVAKLLASARCTVVAAKNGQEAIETFGRHAGEIRLALIDMSMPRVSGEKVARELRRLSANLPIVLMSGYADLDKTPQLTDLGLAGYLQKPFRLPALLDLLDKILGR